MDSCNAQPSSDAVDTAPLLTYSAPVLSSRRFLRRSPPPLRDAAARLVRVASTRRFMLREPSVRVRETAAEHLEERQSGWAYSKPLIVVDILLNLALVVIAVAVLGLSRDEKPVVPLRIWISGYGSMCLLHVACVVLEYRRRNESRVQVPVPGFQHNDAPGSDLNSRPGSETGDSEDNETEELINGDEISVAKCLESANRLFSFVLLVIGFCWIIANGQALSLHSPLLYWLCVTFLAFDAAFAVICCVLACLISLVLCCCLPCMIALMFVLTDREGATDEEIDRLPKYKFRKTDRSEEVNGEIQESHGGIMIECNTDTPTERILSHEDAECCICLCAYENGIELRELACLHHFHCSCIETWLRLNATCPLCKFNILNTSASNGSEEV